MKNFLSEAIEVFKKSDPLEMINNLSDELLRLSLKEPTENYSTAPSEGFSEKMEICSPYQSKEYRNYPKRVRK